MNVYIVEVIPEASLGRVSQEGYTTLEKAQAFIEGRSYHPRKVSEYMYVDDEETHYLIFRVKIV